VKSREREEEKKKGQREKREVKKNVYKLKKIYKGNNN
jgi:hypothetical protein